MASCGTPLLEQRWKSKHSDSDQAGYKKGCSGVAHAAVGLILLSLLVGCVKGGSMPMTDNLGTLKVGASTPADVLLALGQPRGDGAANFTADLSPRKIWFYDYSEMKIGVIRQSILLVFFNQEKYDGHLWFSSIVTKK